MSNQGACDGWVRSLKGQQLVFTGKVTLGGKGFSREYCARRARGRGAKFTEHFFEKVTLVVHGDLASAVVIDPKRQFSQKLVAAQDARRRGQHVHVVDADGFEELLGGRVARCRTLHKRGNGVLPKAEPGDEVFGGPLVPGRPSLKSRKVLTFDLSGLDRGTAAHEQTVRALRDALKKGGRQAQGPHGKAPQFDAGWLHGSTLFIAEVKSLRGTNEDQQIRLGLGQVLDYAHQLRKTRRRIQPVLVLEREPRSARWGELVRAHGALLAFGPAFATVVK
jgi:hypothetical protein